MHCAGGWCLPGGVSASGLAGLVNMTLVNSFVLMLKINCEVNGGHGRGHENLVKRKYV